MFESDLQYILNMPQNPPPEGPWYTWAQGVYQAGQAGMFPDSLFGPGYRGEWMSDADGISDWDSTIWGKLVMLDECASDAQRGCN